MQPRNIFWNKTGNIVCLATEECCSIYAAVDSKQILGEVHEQFTTALWVGDCFIYTNSVHRINYYVGGEIVTISHLDPTIYLLGYVESDNRLYFGDKKLNVRSKMNDMVCLSV